VNYLPDLKDLEIKTMTNHPMKKRREKFADY
jgi:hypothetical protein